MKMLSMMPQQTDVLFCKSLIFHHAVAFLLLTHSDGGGSQVIGQPQPIVARFGDDITLPCHVDHAMDAADTMLEWSKLNLDPRFVHVRRSGQDHLVDQNPSYEGRTSVSLDGLKHGDMSLNLAKVKVSDEGTYRCFIPALNTESNVQLVVGAVSSPIISLRGIDGDKDGVVLQCESSGWYPEPEVLWLDGEGKLLSAGPTETVRGPDDLYTVSSRVTVEKRHSNSFTCRVHQKDINHTTETQFTVPDDFVEDSYSSTASTIIGLVVGMLLILMVALIGWKWRQHTIKSRRRPVDEETQRGADSNDSEQESLLETKTDVKQFTPERETLTNQHELKEENKSEYLGEETGHSCQKEQGTQQEKTEAETNNHFIQPSTEEENKSVKEETPGPVPAEAKTQQENTEAETNNTLTQDKKQSTDAGTEKNKTKSVKEETAGPGPNAVRRNDEGTNSTETASPDQKGGDGQQQHIQAKEKANNDPDTLENTESRDSKPAGQGSPVGETQPKEVGKGQNSVDRTGEKEKTGSVPAETPAQCLMDGDGAPVEAGGEAKNGAAKEENTGLTQSTNEKTNDQVTTNKDMHHNVLLAEGGPMDEDSKITKAEEEGDSNKTNEDEAKKAIHIKTASQVSTNPQQNNPPDLGKIDQDINQSEPGDEADPDAVQSGTKTKTKKRKRKMKSQHKLQGTNLKIRTQNEAEEDKQQAGGEGDTQQQNTEEKSVSQGDGGKDEKDTLK